MSILLEAVKIVPFSTFPLFRLLATGIPIENILKHIL